MCGVGGSDGGAGREGGTGLCGMEFSPIIHQEGTGSLAKNTVGGISSIKVYYTQKFMAGAD